MPCRKLNITDFFRFTETKKIITHEVTDLCFAEQKINFDKETGLVYYNYRYYSAELGRWLSRDPFAENGGENMYSFLSDDAINYSDLLGLCKESLFGCQSDRFTFGMDEIPIKKVAKAFGADIEFKFQIRVDKTVCNKCCSDCSTSKESTMSYQLRGTLQINIPIEISTVVKYPVIMLLERFVDTFLSITAYGAGGYEIKNDGCTGKTTGSGCLKFGGTVSLRLQTDKWIGRLTGYSIYGQGGGHVTCKKCVTIDGQMGDTKCKGEYRFRIGIKKEANWFHAEKPVYEHIWSGKMW